MLQQEIASHVCNLRSKDANAAYASLLALEAESRNGESVAAYHEEFEKLLSGKSAFMRIRGFRLLAVNACWIERGTFDARMPAMLACLHDAKPIVVRQCIAALPELLAARPDLKCVVCDALRTVCAQQYADSMAPLVKKDVAEALRQMGVES